MILNRRFIFPCISPILCSTTTLEITQHGNLLIHRARDTIQLLQQKTPDFIGPDLWPPNSPDLNPVDYKIWGVMQQRVYERREQRR